MYIQQCPSPQVPYEQCSRPREFVVLEAPSPQPWSDADEPAAADGRSTADIIAAQSQDYVDEKLAEYQATIYMLQGATNVFLVFFRFLPDCRFVTV